MADDPNTPATEPKPIPETMTCTFDEWCDEIGDELKAKAEAFKKHFGPMAEQKMDHGTLTLHLKSLEDHEAAQAAAPAAPTEPPPASPPPSEPPAA